MTLFADADGEFESSEFVIFGVPFDETSSYRRGSRLAPLAIRMASFNFETYDIETGVDLSDVDIHDAGDVELDAVTDMVARILDTGTVPIMLGGEHTATVGACAAHDMDVIYLDAHADFRDEYLGEKVCHATVARRLVEQGHRVIHIGLRSMSREESGEFGTSVTTLPFDLSMEDLDRAVSSEKVYVSIDMDAIDPSEAPGVANPEPNGLPSKVIYDIISHLGNRIAGLDIVEVCPPYDPGTTSLLAAHLVRHAIFNIAAGKP